jgi:pimeloyl-ACP methyl ester carboxylesterase
MTNSNASKAPSTISETEKQQVARANASGKQPVVFVHGLWLLASSWDPWVAAFEEAGYAVLAPGWPGDPSTVAEAKAHPDAMANKTIGQVADHYAEIINALDKVPAIVGHSFGGLIVEILAGRGLAATTVAISPAPMRGVLPVPESELKSIAPILKDPQNRKRAVPLTYEQFRFSFANAVSEDEAKNLYQKYSVPGSGDMIFQGVLANLNPWSEAKVEQNEARNPMLIIYGGKDNTVPPANAKASFEHEDKVGQITDIIEMPDCGHSLTIDNGWRDVCDRALAFIKHYAPVTAA